MEKFLSDGYTIAIRYAKCKCRPFELLPEHLMRRIKTFLFAFVNDYTQPTESHRCPQD